MHVLLISIILSIITLVSLKVVSFDLVCSTTKSGFIYSSCNVGRIKCARHLVFAPFAPLKTIYIICDVSNWLTEIFLYSSNMTISRNSIFLLYLTTLARFVARIYLFCRNFWIVFYVMLVVVFGVTVGVGAFDILMLDFVTKLSSLCMLILATFILNSKINIIVFFFESKNFISKNGIFVW